MVHQNPQVQDGTIVNPLHPYGIGIDTHRDFIQVCCLVQRQGQVFRHEREFQTTWPDLSNARMWAAATCGLKPGTIEHQRIRYTIESTGTYHQPVLLNWQGVPSVVNPTLAGSTKRKTDVLDARLLAHHAITGLWPASFVPSRIAECLRVLVGQRNEAGRNATRALNRINGHLLRFGHTIGREHSAADPFARGTVEDLCRGIVGRDPMLCPDGIPDAVRPFFHDAYRTFDFYDKMRKEYQTLCVKHVKAHAWPIATGTIQGTALLEVLKSVPGIGEVSALVWLSVICDPKRFNDVNQVHAFCGADPSLKVSAGKVTQHVKRKGNAKLHHTLKNVAAQLVRRKDGPIGQWGFGIVRRHAKGGWARAINAVSRRLAGFLWAVHCRGVEFSYDKYKFFEVPQVVDMPVAEMKLAKRYETVLLECGLTTSQEVARAFHTSLPQQKGIGASCLQKVKAWLDANRLLVQTDPLLPTPPRRKHQSCREWNPPGSVKRGISAVSEYLGISSGLDSSCAAGSSDAPKQSSATRKRGKFESRSTIKSKRKDRP